MFWHYIWQEFFNCLLFTNSSLIVSKRKKPHCIALHGAISHYILFEICGLQSCNNLLLRLQFSRRSKLWKISYHVISFYGCHLMSTNITWCKLMFFHVNWCYQYYWCQLTYIVLLCHPMLFYINWCNQTSTKVTWCYPMSSDVICCHVMSSNII